MKKVFKILLIVIILLALLVGGYFALIKLQEKSVLNVVDEIFVALKTGDSEKIKQYIDFEETQNEEEALENIAEDDEMAKVMMKNLTYEVTEKNTKLNNCKIKLKISNKDFKTILGNYFTKAFTLAFSQAFGGITEEEMNKQLEEYFIEQFNSESVNMITNEVEIEAVKENGDWTINYDKEKLINAILPGYKEVMESFESIEE